MFTGIITATGIVESLEDLEGDLRLRLRSPDLDLGDLRTGDSIAVSGVCLTLIDLEEDACSVDVSRQTAALTTLAGLAPGAPVNLEKALAATDRFGGHLVSGHVDGVAQLLSSESEGRSKCLWFEAPESLAQHIAPKGSVCLDGVSLTVAEARGSLFSVNVIPHTLEKTTFPLYETGQRVNLEVDLISRYLKRLLECRGVGSLTLDKLKSYGFADANKSEMP